jgi:cellulose synthase/poly-beta-1,6-N-acetylglucosamine synthase-like glycosyltransferase
MAASRRRQMPRTEPNPARRRSTAQSRKPDPAVVEPVSEGAVDESTPARRSAVRTRKPDAAVVEPLSEATVVEPVSERAVVEPVPERAQAASTPARRRSAARARKPQIAVVEPASKDTVVESTPARTGKPEVGGVEPVSDEPVVERQPAATVEPVVLAALATRVEVEEEEEWSADEAPGPYDYSRFSMLAGEFAELPASDYRVQLQRLRGWRPIRTYLLVLCAFIFITGFFVWLMLPSHWHDGAYHGLLRIASIVMVVNIGCIGVISLISLFIICRASLIARNPVPVRPQPGTSVAFLTTIVPSHEPLAMVRRTLEAALRIRHEGPIDVWLLDEGDDADVKAMCRELGVHHFTRRGVERLNQPDGQFKARSKHGNYNSWLDAHGPEYDFFVSVDPDHVPMPCMAERLLGYFRDPDVAFVVGPQVYGNYRGFVTRSAESQQFLFHSLLQRAANRGGVSMLVGTNNAVRISTLAACGGLRDSVTEDLATSIVIHSARNPATHRRWRSVYTPDVLAVGEGPSTFTDYFIQQSRWALGGNEVVMRQFPRAIRRLGPRRTFHYALLIAFYPTTAIAWTLGVTNGLIYLILGGSGLTVSPSLWLMLYFDGAALQVGLYFWNRRHNVSPHEGQGSPGLAGMVISTLTVPIYATAMVAAARRRRSAFVVTPKGDAASRDSLGTFRRHLQWAAPILVGFFVAALRGTDNPWMCVWSVLALLVCLGPIAIWQVGRTPLAGLQPVRRARRASVSIGRRIVPRERRVFAEGADAAEQAAPSAV